MLCNCLCNSLCDCTYNLAIFGVMGGKGMQFSPFFEVDCGAVDAGVAILLFFG